MTKPLDAEGQQTVVSHLGLVDRCMGSLSVRREERDDCFQAGAVALVKAVATRGEGEGFGDYAFACIRNAIQAHRVEDSVVRIGARSHAKGRLGAASLASLRPCSIGDVDPQAFACTDEVVEWPAVDIGEAVDALPAAQKRYAVECLIGGRPMKTVATAYGIDESAVRCARDAAFRNLQKALGPKLFVPLPTD